MKLALSIDQFSKRVLKPKIEKMAAELPAKCSSLEERRVPSELDKTLKRELIDDPTWSASIKRRFPEEWDRLMAIDVNP